MHFLQQRRLTKGPYEGPTPLKRKKFPLILQSSGFAKFDVTTDPKEVVADQHSTVGTSKPRIKEESLMAAVEHSTQATPEGGWDELSEPVALHLVDPAPMPARPVIGRAVQLSRRIRLQLLDMEQEVARRDLEDALSERVIGEWSVEAAAQWADDRTDEFADTLRDIQSRRRLL